ncbi:unnamed protein product [Bemisia tabaci]|uniref:JmjC domain-containing protein n=1 Tax=Bemisia tabaci TaxID=7038 RepID=A0A9P0A3T3_BEMTA|nr:unnamed protein product [Bemisia tabaci]
MQPRNRWDELIKVLELDRIPSLLDGTNAGRIAGVESQYLYYGKAGTVFAYHLEDCNFLSVNIHLGGAPKVWRTVEALADPQTPFPERVRFYRNNPIPGARCNVVPAAPFLLNPDEIMPPNYNPVTDLDDDFRDIRGKLVVLAKELSKYFTKPVDFSSYGSRTMLVSDDQNGMRVVDRGLNETVA